MSFQEEFWREPLQGSGPVLLVLAVQSSRTRTGNMERVLDPSAAS